MYVAVSQFREPLPSRTRRRCDNIMIVYLSTHCNDAFSYWEPSRAVHGAISLNTVRAHSVAITFLRKLKFRDEISPIIEGESDRYGSVTR